MISNTTKMKRFESTAITQQRATKSKILVSRGKEMSASYQKSRSSRNIYCREIRYPIFVRYSSTAFPTIAEISLIGLLNKGTPQRAYGRFLRLTYGMFEWVTAVQITALVSCSVTVA
jgi:hypothetical protein